MENNNTADNNAPLSGSAIADALAALQAIESVLGKEDLGNKVSETSFDIPFADVLAIMPEEFISNTDPGQIEQEHLTITVKNLFSQLKRGKVSISVSELAYFLPSQMVEHSAFSETDRMLPLSLATVVNAINVNSLKERTAKHIRRYHIDDLRDPFAKPTQTPQAPVAEVAAVPATPVPTATPIVSAPVPPPTPQTPVAEPVVQEVTPAPEPVVPTTPVPIAEPIVSAPIPPPIPQAPVVEPVIEEVAAVPEPIVTATPVPIAEPIKKAVPQTREMENTEHKYQEFSGNVEINTASLQQMITLDGVSQHLAEKIIAYREEHGLFSSIFDLYAIQGLGRKTFKHITGMPYTNKKTHRSKKLVSLLGIPITQISSLRAITEALASKPGFIACIISGDDGLLVAQSGGDDVAEQLSAIALKTTRQVKENMQFIKDGQPDSISICSGRKMYTIVADETIALTTIQQGNKITKSQLGMVQKVARELAWLLSHRAYVARPR